MHFAIVIAAVQVFGPISTDLHPIVAAIDRAVETLKTQSHRVVTTDWNAKQKFGNESATGHVESTRQHEFSERGHLFSWQDYLGQMHIACITSEDKYEMKEAKGGWSLTKIFGDAHEKWLWSDFSETTFGSLSCIGHVSLFELVISRQYAFGVRPLDRNCVVIWGMHNLSHNDGWPHSFRAVVRFSDSKKMAYLERVEYHTRFEDRCHDTTATSNAHFRADTLIFNSSTRVISIFSGSYHIDDISTRKLLAQSRSRTVADANTDFTEQHYQPEFYGFDRKTILEAAKPKPINTSPLSMSSERIDLLIAIGIPLGLLGVLLLVIRKT